MIDWVCVLQDNACNANAAAKVQYHITIIGTVPSDKVISCHGPVIPEVTLIGQNVIHTKFFLVAIAHGSFTDD